MVISDLNPDASNVDDKDNHNVPKRISSVQISIIHIRIFDRLQLYRDFHSLVGGLTVTTVNSKSEAFSDESLFMALIFQLQKMINHLVDELSKYDTNMRY